MQKPLVIGVDVRDLRVAKTGTRTYLLEICREFKKMQTDNLQFEFLDWRLPVYSGNNKLMKWLGHLSYQTWKQLILPLKARQKRCDIVFCTDNFVPLLHLGYQTIPVFHDAFFFENPENYGKLWLWLYKKTALPAARRSPFVVTPTEYSKSRLQHFTGIEANKLKVVYEGAPHQDPTGQHPQLSDLQLPINPQEYILHAGSFFKRKNIPSLVKAFAQLKASGYANLKLVLAGPLPVNKAENNYFEVIKATEEYGVKNDVIITGYLTDDNLKTLYRNAALYAFPSVNEGFGLPVLEAFSNGLPVVVANNTCLPEVGGDAVLTFDPFDADDIFKTIKKVLDDKILREAMIARGHEQLKYFSWQQTAVNLIEIFRTANSKRR